MDSIRKTICVSVCEPTVSELITSISSAGAIGDLVELRLDCLQPSEIDAALSQLPQILSDLSVPSIITRRPGEGWGDFNERFSFWTECTKLSGAAFFDLELELVEHLSNSGVQFDWQRVICSCHDDSGTTLDLHPLYERMSSLPARVLKIAVTARDATDCVQMFGLLERAKLEGRDLIGIMMGEAGIMTRVLGPSYGSFLTYGSIALDTATAPGQPKAEELKTRYRVNEITDRTRVFGVIGSPVTHSLSPVIHNAAFADAGIDAVYLPFEVAALENVVADMIHPRTRKLNWKFAGLSVTAPHKTAIIHLLDWVDPAAAEIGAVNTVVVENDRLFGYNTDAEALVSPLSQDLKRAAIIGSGGAAKAAAFSLLKRGANVTVFGRNPERAQVFKEVFGVQVSDLDQASFDGFDVVINATPLGARGEFEAQTPASASQLRGAALAYDLVYNPVETLFLREAREAGCETLNGLPMFLAQAAVQFQLWTGKSPNRTVMHAAAMKALS